LGWRNEGYKYNPLNVTHLITFFWREVSTHLFMSHYERALVVPYRAVSRVQQVHTACLCHVDYTIWVASLMKEHLQHKPPASWKRAS
jgi:hypothetical protein